MPDSKDVRYKNEDGSQFNMRVGCIIIQNDSLLLCKNPKYPNFYLLGGGVQYGETSEEAAIRECLEETKQRFTVDRPLFYNENFYKMRQTIPTHEICMYFLMKSSQPFVARPQTIEEDYGKVEFHFRRLRELKDLILFPEFLKTELINLPTQIKYIVTKN